MVPSSLGRHFTFDRWERSLHCGAVCAPVNRNGEKNYEIWEDSRHEGEQDVENILSGGRKEKAAGITGIHEHRREGK